MTFGVLCGMTMAGAGAMAQTPGAPLPPLSHAKLQQLLEDPAAMAEFRAQHSARPGVAPVAAEPAEAEAVEPDVKTPKKTTPPPVSPGAWVSLAHKLPGDLTANNPILMTDGTVLVNVSCAGTWYRLTPDNTGSYVNGTWSQIASMPNGYTPRFFSSAVLPDGRLIAEGGEYNTTNCDAVWTNEGAIYDPVADSWESVTPPSGWSLIGDAEGVVLANGTYMLSDCCTAQTALLNPSTLLWSNTGTGKFDWNDEENWTLLPNGDVLTVDAYTGGTKAKCGKNTEEYVPGSGTWIKIGNTTAQLSDCSGKIQSFEAPTQILRPNGTVVAFGATTSKHPASAAVHTGIFTPTANKGKGQWTNGPAMPKIGKVNYTMADAPAAILPDGTVLIAASPNSWVNDSGQSFPPPTHFFTFNGTAFTQIADLADWQELASFEVNFLVLPTGEILTLETDYPAIEVFRPSSVPNSAWAPTITTVPSSVTQGQTYTITGTQLSGLTQGASYGDDVQMNTNYPLVRITNTGTSHVYYAKTTGFTFSVAPGAVSQTSFTLPLTAETGASTLVVVTNGIASASKPITVVSAN